MTENVITHSFATGMKGKINIIQFYGLEDKTNHIIKKISISSIFEDTKTGKTGYDYKGIIIKYGAVYRILKII